MRFYLGTHQPSWLARTSGVPLMLSHRRLAPMRRLPVAVTRWALDSGGFTELSLHGGWTISPAAYSSAVRRYQAEIGNLDWAAPMDWMCEPPMLRRTGRTVRDHQRLTVDNYLRLREENLPVIPVLQGWQLTDYLHCLDLYGEAGVDLAAAPLVGLGSVCRRQHTTDIAQIVGAFADRGLRLHGFGVKTSGLHRYGTALASCDSMAWSMRGRHTPGCTSSHQSESNCPRFALAWREQLLAQQHLDRPDRVGDDMIRPQSWRCRQSWQVWQSLPGSNAPVDPDRFQPGENPAHDIVDRIIPDHPAACAQAHATPLSSDPKQLRIGLTDLLHPGDRPPVDQVGQPSGIDLACLVDGHPVGHDPDPPPSLAQLSQPRPHLPRADDQLRQPRLVGVPQQVHRLDQSEPFMHRGEELLHRQRPVGVQFDHPGGVLLAQPPSAGEFRHPTVEGVQPVDERVVQVKERQFLHDHPPYGDVSAYVRPWIGSLCTGYAGLDLATMDVCDARLAWVADNDTHVAKILQTRFSTVPNLGDLTCVDWTAVPRVDIVTAGFPCTDISYAGRGAGMKEETRSGLWFTIAAALRVLRPRLIVVENVPALRSRGLDRVLGDLAALGYDTAWTCLRASDVGAPHRRERLFILAADPAQPPLTPAADPGGVQPQRRGAPGILAGPAGKAETRPGDAAGDRHQTPPASPESLRRDQGLSPADRLQGPPDPARHREQDWGPYEPAIRRWETILGRPAPNPTELGTRGQPRLAALFVEWLQGLPEGHVTALSGLPRTAQLKALGNGVVPQQAALALRMLADRMSDGAP